ncbi:Protein-S-isoprenylcysteine O-methyltransferase Ste14 [Limimonas halophila]|uniref:Protein-S-isoprenylcysteine O-methyltransferase Ste14 n=1 Tax=Limimonas halophila TaxID=1082479 RepID=A0A1G7RW22_9PROT|nr:isoprenylcysteine carboxylmethyltransferase family protein [Limimonas halophila]SDG14874.1 Protein-S-isoprenylcysteine O-methyltransferase Ste14 [Limimonas halophila]
MSEKPNVKLPPPAIYAAAVALGLAVEWLWPWSAFAGWPRWMLAGALAGPALALAAWALITFRRADTAVEPWEPARNLVTHGPYSHTRNPMYVALTLLTAGVAVAADLPWVLLAVPLAVLVTDRHVIRREEAHLAHVFGDAYRAYRDRVRRWL